MRCRTLAPAALLVAVATVVAVSPAAGQYDSYSMGLGGSQPSHTVAGVGRVSLQRPPVALRMHIELPAKAGTLKEALAKIQQRREAALLQLEALQVDAKTVKAGNPTLSAAESEQKKRMEQMIAARLRNRGQKVPPGLKMPQTITVSMTLTAEWTHKYDTPEQLLLRVEAIREKVKAAKLAGDQQEEKLSPEEEEIMEEMAMMSSRYDEPEIKPGEPVFLFVSRITDAEREKAMTDAFAKAKANAQSVAKAAGMKLGPLVSLAGGGGGQPDLGDSPYGYEYERYIRRMMGQIRGPDSDEEGTNEAFGPNPDAVAFTFYVQAMFGLGRPNAKGTGP